ncbi:transmembrane protein 177 [Bombus terrestris]|uniref:Transmembrane protein 177 n=1 Tax=Bombus terrestris TaxID=30195 RepID=A0A6P3DHC8_BOMTE|nr:transmembrane protein 177 [Bombus terrestris]XP_003398946.1 transmembrane protein 177 [Bombus terrestris]
MAFARVTLVAGATAIQLFPQTFLLGQYRKIRARYDFENNEIPIRKDIDRRIKDVLDDINLVYRPMIPEERIKFFNVHDIEMFHAGTTYSKYGGLVGIPVNFEYNDISHINNGNISIQSASLQWDAEAIEEFYKSLVLSENAQKFAIAQQILKVTNFDPIVKGLSVFADAILGLGAYELLRSKLKVTKQQRGKNVLCMSIAAIGAFIFTLLTNNDLNYYRETEVNKIMSQIDDKYIQGGVEYYEKLLQRNRALRVLLGSKGTYMYTPVGNQTTWFIQKQIPISEQIDYFKQKMQNIQSQLV